MSWIVILPIILVTLPTVLLTAYVELSEWRERRTPPELRGGWWVRFEDEFRTYAARVANGAGERTRRPGAN
jgi:hypothetical protein